MKKLLVFSLALFSILFLANAFNAIPIADDYRNHVFTRDLGALGFAVDYYLNWSGRFLTVLFSGLFNTLFSLEHLNLVSLIFGFLFLIFISKSAKVLIQDSDRKLDELIVTGFLLVITWFSYRQVLGRIVMWVAGGGVYILWYVVLPFFFMEFIKCYQNKNYSLKLVLLSVILANSIETVPPALIFFMATYILVRKEFFQKESFKFFFSLALLITIASAPLLLAPGNFVRSKTISIYDTKTFLGLFNSYLHVAKIFIDCCANTVLVTIPMALICSSFLDQKTKNKRIQIGVSLIGCALGSALPMGFASEHNGARPASLFVFLTCFGVFNILSTIVIFPKLEKYKLVFTSVILILTSVFVGFDFHRGLAMREHFLVRDHFLNSPANINKDVVVDMFKGKSPRSLNNHDIKMDKNHWINVSVAEYYKLKSITLKK
jgi:hypothetical protein